MKKILGYLKAYWVFVLLAILLLFLQANMDLALPDYMSRIVNIGIQQSGIRSPLPEVIRVSSFRKLLLFMDTESAALVSTAYKPMDPDGPEYRRLLSRFPEIAGQETMVLETQNGKIPAQTETAIQKAAAVSGMLSMLAQNPEMAAKAGAAFPAERTKELRQLLEAEDLPEAAQQQIRSSLPMIMAHIPKEGFFLRQTAIQAVRQEYEALGADIGAMQNAYVFKTGLVMLIFTLISVIATVMVSLIAARCSAGTARRVRSDIFSRVESFSAAEFDRFSTASLITRSTNDITQVQTMVFLILRLVLYAPIMGIGGVIRALGKAPSMAWLIGLAVLVLLVLVITTVIFAMPKFRLTQKLVDRLNKVARENLTGILVVRAFNRQQFEENRFDQANKDLTVVNIFIIRLMAVMMPFFMLIMNLLSVAIIWIGAKEIAASELLVGDMIAFLQYAMQIMMSFMMLTMLFIFLPQAMVSAGRISEVLSTEPSIKDPESPEALPANGRVVVEFRGVSFKYPGADGAALCNISFRAEPGKTTAIIGSTGSGKSTLVNLIPRFYDVSRGEILLDGTDIRRLTQKDLRSRIAHVAQKAVLFSGTIKSNLAYADENADQQHLAEAAETAQAADFIAEKPEGIDAETAQAGSNFSGGQKQRLSIARALVKNCPVYIFDDSFSALDLKTDAALRNAMKKKTSDRTIIIVAQRISTIMNAEQIIVLDDGAIVGIGTHNELMESCNTYREIAVSQLDLKEPV
ncbi:MAG: ABC transporter ATP-binding protein [Spirochaetales bacterium]|nr:ABC transporter ATP-binding protein [Spirochaetales bacterium]